MTPGKRPRLPSFPLLGKDLTELAARRRTYSLRLINAAILFCIFLVMLYEMQRSARDNVLMLLGRGRELFMLLVMVQMWAVYIVLPATVAPAITYEKERNALELLLLTGIGPWQILLQKLVARLVPMLTLILLCVPAMAVAYAFGGFGASQLAAVAYVLLLACLQVAAVGLMWSCFCRTTAEAFIYTYALLGVLYFGPVMVFSLGWEIFGWRFAPGGEIVLFSMTPPYLLAQVLFGGWAGPTLGVVESLGLGVWLTIIAAMALARVWLVRRMHATPRRIGTRILAWVDDLFRGINRATGGRVVFADGFKLPGDYPVAWRETRSRWIGRPNHLLRVLLLIEVPLVLICFWRATTSYGDPGIFPAMAYIAWFTTCLMLIVQTVNVLGSERTHQTLGVLLTTPLSGREIVRQKLAPIRGLLAAMLVPLITIVLFEAWWKAGSYAPSWMRNSSSGMYVFVAVTAMAVYLPLCIWGAALITLVMKSHGRALIASIMTGVGFCLIPLAAALMLLLTFRVNDDEAPFQLLVSFSPAVVIALNEFNDIGFRGPGSEVRAGYVLFAFITTAGVTLLLRHLCYANADALLGRVPLQSRRVPTPELRGGPQAAVFSEPPRPEAD